MESQLIIFLINGYVNYMRYLLNNYAQLLQFDEKINGQIMRDYLLTFQGG